MDLNFESFLLEKELCHHKYDYDLIVIGGGPAGISAAICAANNGMKVLLLEKAFTGGRVSAIASVLHFTGIPGPLSGMTLVKNMDIQLKVAGVAVVWDEVINFNTTKTCVFVHVMKGDVYRAPYVVLSTGLSPKKLGVPGEDKYYGLGVSYFVMPDKDFFKNKIVAIVGGGNYALAQASYLEDIASEIVLIYRNEDLKGFRALREPIEKSHKYRQKLGFFVDEIIGEQQVVGLKVTNRKSGIEELIDADAVVICVGMYPQTGLVTELVQLDERGFIITDEYMCTTSDRIYAAGDVRSKMIRQIITAAADGLIAAKAIYERY